MSDTLKKLSKRWNDTPEWHDPPFLDGKIQITTGDLREIAIDQMKMFGFVVYPDGSILPVIVEDEVLDIQKAVGGYFELIEETDTYFVYVDEDGHSKRLKPNVHTFSLIKRKVTLVGPVLFLFKNPVDKQEE